jgi:hypothetical protein
MRIELEGGTAAKDCDTRKSDPCDARNAAEDRDDGRALEGGALAREAVPAPGGALALADGRTEAKDEGGRSLPAASSEVGSSRASRSTTKSSRGDATRAKELLRRQALTT